LGFVRSKSGERAPAFSDGLHPLPNEQIKVRKQSKFHRFRPVTVRAAARLVTLERLGRLTGDEARLYFRALALTEPGVAAGAHERLRRLAQRRSAFGRTGVLATRRRAGTRIELSEMPECMRGLEESLQQGL
jgi:hypothetical protein